MADPQKNPEENKPDKTIGKEGASEATNGIPSEETLRSEIQETVSEISRRYDQARQELNESVARLRNELSKFDVDEARQRARSWVEENPTLAFFLALGGGILAGKLLASALKPPPPPSLTDRLRMQSRSLASQAQRYMHDAGDAGERLVRRAGEASEVMARRAEALAATAAERAVEWSETLAEESQHAAALLREKALEATDVAREKTSHGVNLAEAALNAARTVVAAVVIKKVSDWFRRLA